LTVDGFDVEGLRGEAIFDVEVGHLGFVGYFTYEMVPGGVDGDGQSFLSLWSANT
jgi:hypothetical protein